MERNEQQLWKDLNAGFKPLDPLSVLDISSDGMTCNLSLEEGQKIPDLDELLTMLSDRGVSFGVDKSALIEISKMKESPVNIVIARGMKARKGQPSEVRRCYRILDDSPKSGTQYQYVKKNELLAVKLRNTNGVAGRDIYGLPVEAEPGDDVAFIAGKNVQQRFFPDKIEYSALCDGLIKHGENRVDIESLFVVESSVNEEMGAIEFPGNILVKGHVLKGGSITCRGSVTVEGDVLAAQIEADDSVIVKGKVDQSSVILSSDTIAINRALNSTIKCRNHLIVGEVLQNCQVTCGGKLQVKNPSGMIAGGVISSGAGIDTPYLGAPGKTDTTVILGSKELLENSSPAAQAMKRIDEEIERINQQMTDLKQSTRELDDKSSIWKMKSLEKQLFRLNQQRREYEKRMVQTTQYQDSSPDRVIGIIVRKRIYPVVKLRTDTAQFILDHELDRVELFPNSDTGEWQVTSLDRSR